jgi:hypothetical protein
MPITITFLIARFIYSRLVLGATLVLGTISRKTSNSTENSTAKARQGGNRRLPPGAARLKSEAFQTGAPAAQIQMRSQSLEA